MDINTSTALDGDVRTTSPVSPNKNDTDASPRIESQTNQEGREPKVTTTYLDATTSAIEILPNLGVNSKLKLASHTSSRSIFLPKRPRKRNLT